MSNLFPKQKIEGILALVGGFSLHLTLGTLYCFGNMSTYMTSYLRKHVDPDITYSDMIWIPTLSTIGQGVFMTLSGHLEERIGVRFTLLVGSSIMTAGVYLTAFTIRLSTFLTIFTYGFMFGLGTALAYAPPLAVAMRWFPRQKGLVNGVIVGGFGLGAFVFNQIQSIYLNPNNEALDSDGFFSDDVILNRVPSVFLLLGSIYGIIQAMAILLISTPSSSDETSMLALVPHDAEEESEEDDVDALEDEDDELFHQQQAQPGEEVMRLHGSMNNGDSGRRAAAGVNVTLGNAQDAENLKPSQVVKSREFWTLWLTFFLNTQAITYINSMYKAYGQTFINDDHFLSIVGALAAIFNASGRIFWGHLCDKFGYRSCMMFISVSIAVLFVTFAFVPVGGKALFAFWVWAIFFSFCANFVLLPTATAQCFGTKYASKNYGLVMSGQAVAAPLTALLTQHLNPVIGWSGMFQIIAVFSLTCAFLQCRFPRYPSPRAIMDRLAMTPSQL